MFFDEWGEDLIAALSEPFAPADHKTKKQGGSEITFVDVHKYKERLNATVGPHGWSNTVRLDPIGGKLVATVALTILGVTKENVGDEDEDKDSFGTASTNAFAQAFKRVASDFSLGSYLYDPAKRDAASKSTGYTSNGNRAPAPATVKQLDFAAKLVKSHLFTEDERAAIQASIAKNPTAANVSKAIDRMQTQIKGREPVAV